MTDTKGAGTAGERANPTIVIEQHIASAIHGAERLADELDRGAGARELALAKTKLEEAQMWLGRSRRAHELQPKPQPDGGRVHG